MMLHCPPCTVTAPITKPIAVNQESELNKDFAKIYTNKKTQLKLISERQQEGRVALEDVNKIILPLRSY
jgi:hypothetical protein